MYDGQLKEDFLFIRVQLRKNLKPKSRMPLPQDPDSFAEELKRVQLQCYVWLNAFEAALPSLNTECYG